ncbi:hypothetical protein H7I87_18420 [Mycobacterium timonense]|uniref:Uncharacterized protein n=2 Tax=Mycobacterium avium complex (MAC) TaxID=120793 RepID=A0AAW5SAS6_MYCBC|nr:MULTISPECIES: hypothetical protein [Mycobacterium avium complex (MAC)]MCV6991821.1 hypothetical protein [Mycobacterium bouchedurhonense]MCV6996658.1 hypothetical protein [Mycobacterium timonense]ORA42065.1 hypothetical protein BST19_26420 [Mycobacterium bouchedurhonense]ORB77319.1 hypothetical protein BST46_25170 [Mycobacterium timonense]
MGELAMRPIDRSPTLGDVEDRGDLLAQQRVHRPPGRLIDQGADIAAPGSPAVHTRVGDLPQRACPGVGEPGRDCVVDALQDGFLDLGGDPRRHRPA